MKKLKIEALMIAAFACGAILLASCGSAPTTSTTNTAKPADASKTDAPSGDKVGVAECDDYIVKYEACLNKNVPEAARGFMKEAFEKQREGFKKAAADPTTKAELPNTCKKIKETAATQMAMYKCDW